MREIHIIRLKKSLMFLAVVVSLIFLIDRFDLPIDKNLHASVYAAIFTLAAITGSLITIISGTLSKKIFDIPMDVFLHLNVYLFDPLYLLLLSVMIVAFSTLTFLLNGLLATLFYLALELIYIALFSAMMWKMATSERFCIRLLEKEIHMRDKKANWKYILGCLFSYYGREIVCTAAQEGDRANECAELIVALVKEEDLYTGQRADIQRFSTEISKNLLLWDNLNRLGLKSLDAFWRLFPEKNDPGRLSLISNCAKALQYMDEREVFAINFEQRILEAAKEDTFREEEKQAFLYNIVKALAENARLSPNAKKKVLARVLRVNFGQPLPNFILQPTTCILVFQHLVLENENWDRALMLFECILGAFRYSLRSAKEFRASVMAYMYALQCTYAIYEEDLSEERRKKILSLATMRFEDPVDSSALSFSAILKKDIKDILHELRKICDGKEWIDFDYWGKSEGMKMVVWERSRVRQILYFTCFLNAYCIHGPIYRSEDWESHPPDNRREILTEFLSLFDKRDSGLTSGAMEEIGKIAVLAGLSRKVDRLAFADLFETANEELKGMMPAKTEILCEHCEKDLMYCEDESLLPIVENMHASIGCYDKTIYTRENLRELAHSGMMIDALLENTMKKYGKAIKLSYDAAGVKKLCDLFEQQKIGISNYRLEEWYFPSEARNMAEFADLKRWLEKIFVETIYAVPFFSDKLPRYKFILRELEMKEVDESEVEKICEENKIAEDRYSVQFDCVLNLAEAKEYVRKNYTKDTFVFEIKHNFSSCGLYYLED